MNLRKIAIGLAVIALVATLAGCTSDADKASENISHAAEAFEVQRTIVGINGITGETIFYAEGRCSFEHPDGRRADVTCKYGPDEYRRHTFLMYHTRIILKPQNVIPEFDIMVGED